eukprot:1529624-Pyramimonas_sp.AAC.1
MDSLDKRASSFCIGFCKYQLCSCPIARVQYKKTDNACRDDSKRPIPPACFLAVKGTRSS